MSATGRMRAEFVNPFIESVYDLCRTMLNIKVLRTGLAVTDTQRKARETMAIIGFSGMVKGTVALAFSNDVCIAMVKCLLGEGSVPDEETISDTISEVVNIVGGSAKSKISESVGQLLELSLPVVLRGDDYEVYSPSKAIWLEIPFRSDVGDFTLRLSFEEAG